MINLTCIKQSVLDFMNCQSRVVHISIKRKNPYSTCMYVA